MEYQQNQQALNRLKRKYYDFEEKLALPHHSRYYYNWLSRRTLSLSIVEKLADLGFLVTKGFDLQQSVSDYKVDREENITESIPQTFRQYIIYMRYGEYLHFIDMVLQEMTEEELIDLFVDEVMLRYNDAEHTVRIADWDDDKLIAACTGKEMYERYVRTTEWSKSLVTPNP